MSAVQTVEERLLALEQEHEEFKKVHVSRRGVQGVQGERGEQGPQGVPADPKQVAELAAEIVKKAFRYDTQIAKFESLLKSLESEIVAVKASLRWAVIEELKASGVIDAEGRAVPGPAGADSTVLGPRGEKGDKGDTGPAGKDGIDGRDGQDAKSVVGPQGPAGKNGADSTVAGPCGERGEIGPEGLRGYPGKDGISRDQVVALVLDMHKRGTFRN